MPALLALLAPSARAAEAPADLVLRGGVVHTMDAKRPRAEAIAVRGNRILADGHERRDRGVRRTRDTRRRARRPHGRAGLRGRARAPARDRLRAPGRRPHRRHELRRGGRARRRGGPAAPARRVDPRAWLARGQVDAGAARRGARLPDAPGALGRDTREPGRPRARGRPRGPRERAGDGAAGDHAPHEGPGGRRADPGRRRASRPASSSTTRRGSWPRPSGAPRRTRAPSSWRWTPVSRTASRA